MDRDSKASGRRRIPRGVLIMHRATETYQGRVFDYFAFSSPAEMLAFVRSEPAILRKAQKIAEDEGQDWCGLGSQQVSQFLESGFSTHAMTLFSQAVAKLEAERKLGRGTAPAVNGGAWVMPLVLQGNPLAARRVTREKLAPKIVRARIGTNGSVNASVLTEPAARIARALWDYQMQGGIVNLSLWQASQYQGEATTGAYGIRVDCQIPIVSDASFSTALSVALYRVCYLAIGNSIGRSVYSLGVPSPPDVIWLDGNKGQQDAALRKAGIQ